MINFYPGPSKIYPDISNYFEEGLKSGIFGMNHRSTQFHKLFSSFKNVFKNYFQIPEAYEISILSSATETWEILNQSFSGHSFHHYFNGAFGQKWMHYNQLINNNVNTHPFNFNTLLDTSTVKNKEGIICLTHNETSNGTYLSNSLLKNIRQNNPNALIAVDSTSILGGIVFDFENIDICFSSVQKCLGQPSGMAVLVTSPKVNDFLSTKKKHYNDLTAVLTNSKNLETTHTPNIPGIYNLYQTLKKIDPLDVVSENTISRKNSLTKALNSNDIDLISENEEVHSPTVIAVRLKKHSFSKVQFMASKHEIILGKGYGEHKETSFRIANFPQHTTNEIKTLITFLNTI